MTHEPGTASDPRNKAREEVREIWGRAPEGPPKRTCASCGAEHATYRAHCPACGKRYDRRLPWLTDSMRWGLAAVAVIAAGVAAALILPGVFDAKSDNDAREARERTEAIAAERARLVREQRPQRGRPADLRPPAAGASESDRLAARRALVTAVEAEILADARRRVGTGELKGPIRATDCGPLGGRTTSDDADLSKSVGRYDCTAVTSAIRKDGKRVGSLGYPFIATLDFKRFNYVWCKDSRKPGEGGRALVVVPLEPACLGAEGGKRAGEGYVLPEDR